MKGGDGSERWGGGCSSQGVVESVVGVGRFKRKRKATKLGSFQHN